MNERHDGDGVSRRSFLGTTLAGGAALYAGGITSLYGRSETLADPAVVFLEKTIPELQQLMNSGALSSFRLTLGYLERIYNMNARLRAVIQENPLAIVISESGGAGAGHLALSALSADGGFPSACYALAAITVVPRFSDRVR